MKVGNSVTDSAWARLSHGTGLLTEGGFKGVYKQTFSGFAPNEQLRKTYACYLSTSTGPVGGTLYITNQKLHSVVTAHSLMHQFLVNKLGATIK